VDKGLGRLEPVSSGQLFRQNETFQETEVIVVAVYALKTFQL